MKIKSVKKRDLEDLFALEYSVFKEEAFSRKLLRKLMDESVLFLKLIQGFFRKKVIGFLIALKDRNDRINIINILIHPRFQGKGLGSMLLETAISSIENDESVKYIVLNVKITNEQAIHLYKKHGFSIVRRIKGYYNDKEDSYFMKKNQ